MRGKRTNVMDDHKRKSSLKLLLHRQYPRVLHQSLNHREKPQRLSHKSQKLQQCSDCGHANVSQPEPTVE
jgi:hypothetical protein